MGKRELLLVGVFILLGFVVYQFTAPPSDPARPGFSFSRLVDNIRREIRGQRASAEGRETTTHAVAASVREIRVVLQSGTLTITGEDRQDIETQLHVRSSGYDTPEAERLVKATKLTTDDAGAVMAFGVSFPREGRQTANLTIKVPARLAVRMDNKSGPLKITNVAGVAIGTARGETTIENVPGDVLIVQRGQRVTVDKVGALKLTTTGGAEARISNIRGDVALNLQSGELRASALEGALEVEARNTDLRFENIDKVRGPVRISAVSGELTLDGLRTEARIDGRQTEIRIGIAAPATIGVYNEGGDPIEITLPPDGCSLDALSVNGRISLDEALQKSGLKVATKEPDQQAADTRREERLTGALRGGGPMLTLRANRGDIVLRTK